MDLNNWLYLGVGLGLGVGIGWLSRSQSTDSKTPAVVSDLPANTNIPENNPEVQTLLEQLKQTQLAYQMASQMSRFKGGFLARTSHELRSPLNSTIGALQLILAGLCDDSNEEQEFLSHAHESALKLLTLMDSILSVSKTEHGTDQMQIQPLQLGEILTEVADLTHLLAENRNFRLQLTLPDPNIYVLADPCRFKQVLVNLIDSAVAQMTEGYIGVSTHLSPASGYAHIWIDTPYPAGADKAVFQGLSEPVDLLSLMPVKDSRVYVEPELSTGMKLLINQTLLELMQGRLEVVPAPASSSQASNFIRIQCSLPLVTREPEVG